MLLCWICFDRIAYFMYSKKSFKNYDNYAGYVYIASNPCIPYLKIGYTTVSVAARIADLNKGTGVPAKYKEEYSVYTRRSHYLEKLVHADLASNRVKCSREFFDISIPEARDVLNRLFREVENEIDSDPKLKRIFDCIKYLQGLLKKIDYHEDTLRYKKVRADLSYLRRTGYGTDIKYQKILDIEKQIKSLNGY